MVAILYVARLMNETVFSQFNTALEFSVCDWFSIYVVILVLGYLFVMFAAIWKNNNIEVWSL